MRGGAGGLFVLALLGFALVGRASAATYANPAPITIDDCCEPQVAAPYGSSVTVSGLAGTVTKVTATLSGLTHGAASDLDMLLVGPAGQKVMLLSDTGLSAAGADVTLDQAAGPAPNGAPLISGTYKPTNHLEECPAAGDSFPAPAPAGPYGSSLDDFNATNPTGVWTVYVVDDCEVDAGSIASGFTLTVTTTGSPATPFANPAAFSIGDCCAPTAASPYPSTITVSGTSGTINGGMAVTLRGLTHPYVADLNVLLVGPSGVKVLLAADAGRAASGADVTFSDAAGAGNGIPATANVTTGMYLPTNLAEDCAARSTSDPFPAPAPVAPYGTLLADFDGTSANGTWSLYVVDDCGADAGSVASGWTLNIGGPTAVLVSSFTARRDARGVFVSWRTAQEAGLLGFNLYRGAKKLNRRLIAARARGGARGASYRFLDRGARRGRLSTYRLQAVGLDGTSSWRGTARPTKGASHAIRDVLGVTRAFAAEEPLTVACALLKNGSLRYVTSLVGCRKKEDGITISPGPVHTCYQADGSIRKVASQAACVAPGTYLALPPLNRDEHFCADLDGRLRRVADATQCTAGETGVVSAATNPVSYLTVYDPPGPEAPVTRTVFSTVNATTALDLDGDGTAELEGKLEVLVTGGAGLTVDRTPAAPASLQVSVTATATIPQSANRTASVGYDALASNAPQSFHGDFEFQGATTSMVLSTTSPGASLAVIAELSEPNGPGPNPRKLRVDLEPVPSAASAAARPDATSAQIQLTAASPTNVGVHAEDATGGTAVVLDATVADLPDAATLDVADAGASGKIVAYRAGGTGTDVDATLREMNGSTTVEETLLTLTNAAGTVDITHSDAASAELTADGPIGVADVAFARGGAVRTLDPQVDPASVYRFDDGTTSSLHLRLLGVEHADAALASAVSFSGKVQAGPLRLLLENGSRRIDAHLTALPSQSGLAYDPGAGTLSYTGSSVIGAIRVDGSGLSGGVMPRARDVDLLLQSVPTALSLSFSGGGSTVSIDAGGAVVGLVELLATSGPSSSIPASQDGVELRDLADAYVLGARVTGLRRVAATILPTPDLFLDATGGRTFRADLNTLQGSDQVYALATITPLRPATRLKLEPYASGSKLTYSAPATATSLVFGTNVGARDTMSLTVAPVPPALYLCYSNDILCTAASGSANAGSVLVQASGAATINLTDCTLPLTGCTAANATDYTAFTDLFVQTARLDADVTAGGNNGRVFFDTDNTLPTGTIARRLPNASVDRLTVSLPSGFKAQDRGVTWTGGSPSKTGSVTCPPGTVYDVRLTSLVTVHVADYLC